MVGGARGSHTSTYLVNAAAQVCQPQGLTSARYSDLPIRNLGQVAVHGDRKTNHAKTNTRETKLSDSASRKQKLPMLTPYTPLRGLKKEDVV